MDNVFGPFDFSISAMSPWNYSTHLYYIYKWYLGKKGKEIHKGAKPSL